MRILNMKLILLIQSKISLVVVIILLLNKYTYSIARVQYFQNIVVIITNLLRRTYS